MGPLYKKEASSRCAIQDYFEVAEFERTFCVKPCIPGVVLRHLVPRTD